MKECKYCGAECLDNATRCPNCGGDKFYTAKEINSEMKRQEKEEQNQVNQITTPGINWKKILGILAIITILIVGIIITASFLKGCSADKREKDGSSSHFINSSAEDSQVDLGTDIVNDATSNYNNGEVEYAIVLLSQVPNTSEKYSEAQTLLSQYKQEYRDSIIASADQYAMKEDYASAIDTIMDALSVIDKDAVITEKLSSYKNTYSDKTRERIHQYLDTDNYDAAFELVEESKRYISDSAITNSLYDDVFTAYQQYALSTANSYVENAQYKIALEYLSGICERFPHDSVFEDAYNSTMTTYKTVVREEAASTAKEYVNGGNYIDAINTINKAIAEIGADNELSAILNTYSTTYANNVINEVSASYVKYDINSLHSAQKKIAEALTIIPDNHDLQEQLNYYNEQEPVSLLDLVTDPSYNSLAANAFDFKYCSQITDAKGNNFDNTIAPSGWYNNSHPYGWSPTYSTAQHSWSLDYQYTLITGLFVFDGKYANAAIEVTLTISATPGTEQSWTINNSSGAVGFKFDLSGAKTLNINLKQTEINGTFAYLSDVYVWR